MSLKNASSRILVADCSTVGANSEISNWAPPPAELNGVETILVTRRILITPEPFCAWCEAGAMVEPFPREPRGPRMTFQPKAKPLPRPASLQQFRRSWVGTAQLPDWVAGAVLPRHRAKGRNVTITYAEQGLGSLLHRSKKASSLMSGEGL